jgi:hypothetical protein
MTWTDWIGDHPGRREVLGFFTLDIQDSEGDLQDLLTVLDDLIAGQRTHWQRSGNAYSLTLTPDGAALTPIMVNDQPSHCLSLADLRTAAIAWQHQLKAPPQTSP